MGTEEWGSTIFLVLLVLCGAKPLPKERQEVLCWGRGRSRTPELNEEGRVYQWGENKRVDDEGGGSLPLGD